MEFLLFDYLTILYITCPLGLITLMISPGLKLYHLTILSVLRRTGRSLPYFFLISLDSSSGILSCLDANLCVDGLYISSSIQNISTDTVVTDLSVLFAEAVMLSLYTSTSLVIPELSHAEMISLSVFTDSLASLTNTPIRLPSSSLVAMMLSSFTSISSSI